LQVFVINETVQGCEDAGIKGFTAFMSAVVRPFVCDIYLCVFMSAITACVMLISCRLESVGGLNLLALSTPLDLLKDKWEDFEDSSVLYCVPQLYAIVCTLEQFLQV